MSRGPWKKRQESKIQKMSSDEVTTLKDEIREREESMQESDALGHGLADRGKLSQELEKRRRVLESDEGLIAKGKEKDRIMREIREIEEKVVSERPTSNEMDYRLGTPESDRAVKKNLAFQQKYGNLMVHLQDLRRRLEPEDPTAGSLEYARPDRYDKKKNIFV